MNYGKAFTSFNGRGVPHRDNMYICAAWAQKKSDKVKEEKEIKYTRFLNGDQASSDELTTGQELDDAERAELQSWVKADQMAGMALKEFDHKDAFAKFEKVIEEAPDNSSGIRYLKSYFLPYAAVFLLLLASGYFIWNYTPLFSPVETLEVAAGETTELVLADGTEVTLNAGTIIKYPDEFGEDMREVELSGEAFFKVNHDAEKPFLVHFQNQTVRVLGTSFNIRSYSNDADMEVILYDGAVRLEGIDNEKDRIEMTPGEVVRIHNGKYSVSSTIVETGSVAPEWISGVLVFKNEPLQNVLNDLARTYNKTIKIESETLSGNTLVTASFKKEKGLMAILEALAEVGDFTPVQDNNTILLR